ncbi:hypothetical protein OJ997_25610 [Solirubrobacter phytolaccae]|uniref:Uncharacterized protein n=1 Tax=Solirubrobacter phytolaccae TaxID=1404360 RepID=A0A9X3NEW7_9ACTN|nr:hypothetical protein [Solirubrobacter phytolaccae]MDA0183712.1 hypothetical protein [Solirubrobacter phytolaccae]
MIATALTVLAAATPTPLGPAPNAGFALAGDHALLATVDTEREHQLRVSAIPLAGGPAKPVFAFDGPPDTWARIRFSASATRAAATIQAEPEDGDLPSTFQMVTGPPLGPWTAVAPPASTPPYPHRQQVDGDRVFTWEVREPTRETTVVARDPDPHDVPLRGRDAALAVFAGDLVAYAATRPGDDELGPRRLVIADWRTGAVRRTVDLPGIIGQYALRPDGRVAVTAGDPGALYDIRPGRKPKRYRVQGQEPSFAGDHIVFANDTTLHPYVIDPDGTVRPFGVRTRSPMGFAVDGTNVAFVANDCLLVAPVTAPMARAIGPGPCARGEVDLGDKNDEAKFARRIPVRLRCITAPKRCTGTVDLVWTQGDVQRRTVRVTAGTRFSIPSGRTRTVRVRLSDDGITRLRRHFRRHTRATLAVEPLNDGGSRLPDWASKWMQVRR